MSDYFINTIQLDDEQMIANALEDIEDISKDKIDKILEQRGSIYGEFSAQVDYIASCMEATAKLRFANDKSIDWHTMAEMVYLYIKQARIIVTPEYEDSKVDLEGYAKLIKENK